MSFPSDPCRKNVIDKKAYAVCCCDKNGVVTLFTKIYDEADESLMNNLETTAKVWNDHNDGNTYYIAHVYYYCDPIKKDKQL